MGFDDCYQLGYIQKTHGLQGSVSAFIDADFPKDYEEMESVLLDQNGSLVPFFVSALKIRNQVATITFEDVTTLEEAESLVGTELWLPLDQLPELEEGQFYFHDLIGFDFYDGSKLLGKVSTVYQTANTSLLAVDHAGKEVLVPMEEEIMGEVDSKARKITGRLPEGLLELYTED